MSGIAEPPCNVQGDPQHSIGSGDCSKVVLPSNSFEICLEGPLGASGSKALHDASANSIESLRAGVPGEVNRTSIEIRESIDYLSEPIPVLREFEAILSRRRAERDAAARSSVSVSSPAVKFSLFN